MRAFLLCFTLCGLACLAGCSANDHRPNYVAPPLSDAEVATISGVKTLFAHFYVSDVDGAKVQDPAAPIYTQGSTVKVLPGERRLTVFANRGGGRTTWTFVHTFLAGHHYLIGSSDKLGGMFGTDMAIKDKESGTVVRAGTP
jgi:hypothetical protein